MASKDTPSPDVVGVTWRGWAFVCFYVALLICGWWPAAGVGRVVLVVLGLPALWFAGHQLYGKLLLRVAYSKWRPLGLRGVLVYSDSPHWHDYIEEQWFPRIGERLLILNLSKRRHWRKSLATRLFHHFVGDSRNYNPSVVVLRGLKHPLVFRCFYAFRDAKHDNWEALRALEERLFDELSRAVAQPTFEQDSTGRLEHDDRE